MAEPLGVRQMQIEEELRQLRRARGLQQQEVNTMDADVMREKGEMKLQRARMMKDRARVNVLMSRMGSRPEGQLEATASPPQAQPRSDAPIPSLLAPQQVEPLRLGDTELVEGIPVYVKEDVQLIRSESSLTTVNDRTKELYCGEKGKVVKAYPLLGEGQRGADLKFLDGETRFFTLACLELKLSSKPEPPQRGPPRVAMLGARGAKPADKEGEGPREAPVGLRARVEVKKPDEEKERGPAKPRDIAKSRSKSAVTPSTSSAPAAVPPVKVGQRVLISLAGKTVPATVQYVGATEFAEGEWAGLELSSADGKNDGTVNGKSYFKCKPAHGLFRRANELSGSNRSASPGKKPAPTSENLPKVATMSRARPAPRVATSSSTKTVRLWENGQYGSTVDTVPFKNFVIRQVHRSLRSVLTTATRELQWHQMKRSVDCLYNEDGAEITDIAEIKDGDNLVASWGDSFIPPGVPLPRFHKDKPKHADPAADTPPVESTPAKATPQRPRPGATPTRSPATRSTSSGNRVVKIFENGVYGSLWSDSIPCTTVTIRPTFKTIGSVKTMLARELRWNQCSRKVDYIYNTLGQVLTDVGAISNGDTLVASAGDAFIKPHKDLHERLPPPKVSMVEYSAGWTSSSLEPAAPAEADSSPPPDLTQLREQTKAVPVPGPLAGSPPTQRRVPSSASGATRLPARQAPKAPAAPGQREMRETSIPRTTPRAAYGGDDDEEEGEAYVPETGPDGLPTASALAEMARREVEEARAFLAGQRGRSQEQQGGGDDDPPPAEPEPPRNETRSERIARLMAEIEELDNA